MFNYILIFILGLTLSACQQGDGPSLGPGDQEHLASAAETDCGFVQNIYGQRVSWKGNIPLRLEIHPSFPTEYEGLLKKAAQHWNDAAGMTLIQFVHGESSLNTAAIDSVNRIHWMKDWPETQKGLQALTYLRWTKNQLYEADITINNKHFNFFIDNPTTSYDVHLESLLIHELGHALGLKHRSTVPSVMWAVLNGAIIRDTLTQADRDTLKCEY